LAFEQPSFMWMASMMSALVRAMGWAPFIDFCGKLALSA